MQICGLNKTTLLDYPGRVAATVFLGGCNFRCPFCHNASLVTEPDSQPQLSREEVLLFLKKRAGLLDGVCVTGGEPTLAPDLPDFLRKVKELGLLIKLDTNGYRPDVTKALINEGLVDYIAMDIKSSLSGYSLATGRPDLPVEPVMESISLLMNGTIEYEFRTTVVGGLHTEKDFREIGQLLKGCRAYFLQPFVDSGDILAKGFTAPSRDMLDLCLRILKPTIPNAALRGMD